MELKITAEMQAYIDEIHEITEDDEPYKSLEDLILDALHVLRDYREEKMKELGAMLYAALEEEGTPIEEAFEELIAECDKMIADAEAGKREQ